MGGPDSGRRVRALGTRDRVLSYLAGGEISDPKGMASTMLAAAIGYPGSSAAFAQLLSGMERSGLIERQIRGKRTYRIAAAAGSAAAGSAASGSGASGSGGAGSVAVAAAHADRSTAGRRGDRSTAAGRGDRAVSAPAGARPAAVGEASGHRSRPHADLAAAASGAAGFDYDELARRLLVQVVRRLAVSPGDTPPGLPQEPADSEDAGLQQAVASLEQKLASARSQQRKLTAENAKLREQLQAAQQSLADAEKRANAARTPGELGRAELQLLERLLSASRGEPDRQEEAGAS